LSLAEVSKRSGLDRAALSRLENGVRDNPPLGTFGRYARALGLKILVSLAPNPAAAAPSRRG
jgi:transcriptional regulator with XRE-family HTH domain